MTEWKIETTAPFEEAFKRLKNPKIQKTILSRIKELPRDPINLSYPLTAELAGLRATRAFGQRYRVIFSLEESNAKIVLLLVGIRKDGDKLDIYQLATKLLATNRF